MNDRRSSISRHSRRLRFGTATVLSAALSLGIVGLTAAPASAAVGGCTIYWTGTNSTDWAINVNWSLNDGGLSAGRIPVATDVVCSSTAPVRPTVTIASGTRVVAGMNFDAPSNVAVQLTGGNLTVGSTANGAFDSTIRNFSQGGNTLGGTANVTLTGAPSSLNGTMTGTGTTTVGAGVTASFDGLTLSSARKLVNAGTLNSGANYCMGLSLQTGATMTNQGSMSLGTGCPYVTVPSDNNAANKITNAAGATLTLTTDGSSGASNNVSGVPLVNNGTVNVASSPTTYVSADSSGDGSWTIDGSSRLYAYGTLRLATGTVSGAGVLDVQGTLTAVNPKTIPHLVITNGSFSGAVSSGDVEAGGTLTGTATSLTITPGGTGVLSDAYLNNGFTLVNRGSLKVDTAYVTVPAVIDNYGTIVNGTSYGSLNIYDQSGNGTARLVNRPGATIACGPELNPGSGYTCSLSGLQNDGAVTATGNTAYITSIGGSGTYSAAAGGTIRNSGTLTLAPNQWSGAGTLVNEGTLTTTGAGLTAAHFESINDLTGSVTSPDMKLSGTTRGPGTLTVPTGGTLNLNGLYNYTSIVNHGTATLTNYLYNYTNGSLTNDGLVQSTTDGLYVWDQSVDGSGRVNNLAAGTIELNLPAATSGATLAGLYNSGTLRVLRGKVGISPFPDLSDGSISSGTFEASTGSIDFGANITSNAGTIIVGATGNVFNASASALINLTSNSGSLTMRRSVNTSAAVTNSGNIVIDSPSTFRPGTTYTQSAGVTTIKSGGSLRAGSSGVGAVTINGGTLTGDGGIQGNVTNKGTFAPGGPAGAMAITGTYTQSVGQFAVNVNGTTTAGTDWSKVTATGAASLGGTLAITTSATVSPPVGTSLRILDAASRTGTFSSVTGTDLPNNKYWDVVYDSTGASLVMRVNPIAGGTAQSVTEGNSGTTAVTVPITLDSPATRTGTVDYTTVDQTATAGQDYVATSGTLTFAPGEQSKLVTIQVNGDITYEPDETFLLRLSNPVALQVNTADTVVTIANDDPVPPDTLTVSSVSPSTVGQNAASAPLVITGTDFTAGSTVTFSRAGIAIVSGTLSFVSPTSLKLNVNVSPNMAAGPVDVSVTTAAGTATCAGCLTITGKPTVTTTSPAVLGAGMKNREVTINGTGFAPGAKVYFAGATVTSTSFISSTQIEALVNVLPTKTSGTSTVTVINPDYGRNSCTTTCPSFVPGPVPTAISQTSFARGTTTSVTITGTGFVPGAKITGPGFTFDSVVVTSSTTITAQLTVPTNCPLGTGKLLIVTNPASAGYGVGSKALVTITT
jgi:fibronectin-binding autotransporter adhesin